MKIIKYYYLLIIIIVLISEIVCAQKVPDDFCVNFNFGFHKKDATFDSRKGTLIVNGIDTTITFKLNLSDEEKQTIYNKLIKINFNDYPEKYLYQHSDSEEVLIVSPCQHYFLTITSQYKSKKNVEWDNCAQTKTKDDMHAALMELDRLIEKIIWSRNFWKDYHPSKMEFDPE
jgi:hypothetical protein